MFGEEIDRLFEEKFDLLLGRRTYEIFAAYSAPHSYKLTGSRVSGTGLTIAHYERGGEVKVSDTADDEPSEAEVARQARMKREG